MRNIYVGSFEQDRLHDSLAKASPDKRAIEQKPAANATTWTRLWTASTTYLDLDLISRQSAPTDKLAAGLSDLRAYIGNNRGSIPNYGERYRQGETISAAFVESTINQW